MDGSPPFKAFLLRGSILICSFVYVLEQPIYIAAYLVFTKTGKYTFFLLCLNY